jgi:hypothetical protein
MGYAQAAVEALVYPASPVANEPFLVYVRGSTGGSPSLVLSQNVAVNGSDIAITLLVSDAGFSVPGLYASPFVVPGLAAGNYRYTVTAQYSGSGSVSQATGTISVPPSAGSVAPFTHGLSANWFSDDESGWGINVIQGDSGQLFAVWLAYAPTCGNVDSGASPTWLVMPEGRWLSATQFRGLLYQTGGSPANLPWDSSHSQATAAGVLSLQFVGNDQVTMDIGSANSCATVSKTKQLHRLKF